MSELSQYNFEEQKTVFNIALSIISDYGANEWSFGGGTALSACYWQHRMSYDIDIFTEDALFMEKLLANKQNIAKSLAISFENDVFCSEKNITFVLRGESENDGIKLDFLYTHPLTDQPYTHDKCFDNDDIKIQTPKEIIAKKLIRRENMTVRDFVDFFRFSQDHESLKELFVSIVYRNLFLRDSGFEPIERLITIVEHFNDFDEMEFNKELEYLAPSFPINYKSVQTLIHSLVEFDDTFDIAIHNNEVVSFAEFTDFFKDTYEEIGDYKIYHVTKNDIALTFELSDVNFSSLRGRPYCPCKKESLKG